MIRVLLIPSSDYLGHPFPQRYNQLFERIHDGKNFNVHVLRFNLFQKNEFKSRLAVHEVNDLKIKPVAPYYLFNTPIHVAEVCRIIKQESIDILVLSNLATPFAYTLLDTISNMHIPIIFDLPDYLPTSATGYIINTKSVLGRFLVTSFKMMLHLILRHATMVTTASYALASYATKAGAANVVYLPNGISEHFKRIHNGDRIRNELGFEQDEIIVGYIGSIEFWLDMESLIKGLAIAKDQGLPIKFLLVGKGLHTRYQKLVDTTIKKYGLEKHTVWLDFISHEKVPNYMSALNVGTIPFNIENPTAYYAAPNKLWEYLSQLKPVIATPIPEILHNRKYVMLALNPLDYAKSLLSLRENDKEIIKKTADGRRKSINITWEKSANSLASLLRIIKES